MKRVAIAFLLLLCAAGCSKRPEQPELRSFTHCPFVVRLTASGDLSVSDCRRREPVTFSTLSDGLQKVLSGEEWDKLPPPILIDIDDGAPLSLTHPLLTGMQDAGFYSVGLADGPRREPIMIALPPPGVMQPHEPGGPYGQRDRIDPAAAYRMVIVRVRPDHRLEVTEYALIVSKDGSQAMSPGPAMTATTGAEALPALLASYPKGRFAIYRGQADTPWSEIKGVLRTLVQDRRNQIVLEEKPY
jgi:hypothetical protein